MKKLYTNLCAAKGRILLAALLTGISFTGICKEQPDFEIISHVLKEGSLQSHVEEFKTPLLIIYHGQKYFLQNKDSDLVPLAEAANAAGASELEILKIKTRKNGEKVKLKMLFDNSIVKTTARICPEEPGCRPCENWQIKFLSTRKQGKKLPDNFLFKS